MTETILGYGDNRVIVFRRDIGIVEWRGLAGSFLSHSSAQQCLDYWDNPHPLTTDCQRVEIQRLAANLREALL